MSKLEQSLLPNPSHSSYIHEWIRYVDDVFCVWDGPTDQLQAFEAKPNAYHPNLKFTTDIGGRKMNFLDLTIELTPRNNGLVPTFDIYRKPTFTGVSINGNSLHPYSHKLAAYQSMIHRLISLPLSRENFLKELDTIKFLAARNSVHFNIEKAVKRKLTARVQQSIANQIAVTPPPPSPKELWIRLPFLGSASYRIAHLLKTYG